MAISDASGAEYAVSDNANPDERGAIDAERAPGGSGRRTGSFQRATEDEDVGGTVPSSVIHELRTPLTAIHGYAQVLQRSLRSDPSKARAVNVLLAESTRLAALLNQLSELSEIDSKSPDPAPTRVDVREIVTGLVDQKAGKAPEHSFRVDGAATVRCDARRLTQALSHVLDNAIAYSPDGGAVHVELEDRPDGAHIAIADEGIGVPADDADRVFQRYRRGSNARRAGVRGLGIGLYVARQAVLREGGQIWHAPNDGRGTVFHVVIPDA